MLDQLDHLQTLIDRINQACEEDRITLASEQPAAPARSVAVRYPTARLEYNNPSGIRVALLERPE